MLCHMELEVGLDGLSGVERDVLLVAHRELNTSRRIRLVFDWLVEELRKP